MALFGPRLDRPSVVGDEGRPRATSLTVASLLVFTLFVGTARYLGAVRLTMGIGTAAGLVTAGVALLNRDRFTPLFVGQLCFLPAGAALVTGLTVLFWSSPAYALFVAGFAVALGALGSTWANTASAASVRPALFQGGLSYVFLLVWVVVVAVTAAIGLLAGAILSSTTTPPGLAVVLFLAILLVAMMCFRIGLRWVPVRELAPRRLHATIDDGLARVRRATTITMALTIVGGAFALVAMALGGFALLETLVPGARFPLQLLATEPVAALVLGPGLLVLLLGLVALGLRRLTRPAEASSNRLLGAFVAGFFFVIGLLPFTLSLAPIPLSISPATALLAVVIGPVGLYLVGGVLVVAEYATLVPSRAGGPAIAAAGIVIATVGSALVGVPSPLVFATAAVAMIVWDVSTFGLGVTEELGHLPETRRMELFHALVTVGVGLVAVAVLTALDYVRTSLAADIAVVGAATLAVFGTLLVLVPLRGYLAAQTRD
jgi:hypothetical protein